MVYVGYRETAESRERMQMQEQLKAWLEERKEETEKRKEKGENLEQLCRN